MRRLIALALVAPLLLVAAPAQSEPINRNAVHGFDPTYWELMSLDCEGAPTEENPFSLERVQGTPNGTGALHVDAPDTMAGVLIHANPRHLTGRYVRVNARSGSDPTLAWRVEFNGHVFTSDPVQLKPGTWDGSSLRETTLREGDWSGTIWRAINDFGPAEDPVVGVLTGGCLGSEVTDIDVLGTGGYYYDFEPSRWVEVDHPGGYGSYVKHGKRFRLNAQVMDTTLATGVDHPIRGALVNLRRKVGDHGAWKLVDSAKTGKDGTIVFRQVAPKQDATYKAIWRDRSGKILGTDPANVNVL